MKRTHLTWSTLCLCVFSLPLLAAQIEPKSVAELQANVSAERIVAADSEPGNWMAHGRTYSEQRFSPLKEINHKNVDELGLAWKFDTGTINGLEATPIVVDGIMYVSLSWSEVAALDAKSGELLWRNNLNVDKARARYACCDVVNRGVAVWEGKVFVGTIDGRLVALDAKTGQIVWDQLTVDLNDEYTITGAPRIVKGRVIIGNGGAEFGVRGYITAYDAHTGKQLWRFYTVPGNPANGFESPAMEMAAKTWNGEWWAIGGGGTVWDSMAYDSELNLLYIGVGNGSPWNKYLRSPGGGDNLFLSSMVAINPDDGSYVWHYQTTPGEGWDYTATQHMILADMEIDGRDRKVIMQAPKNGFFYVLDRATGEFISAENYVPVTWATHIDPETGRPVETNNSYEKRPQFQFPSPLGGHNWQPMCYHQKTGYVYIPTREMGMLYAHDPEFEYEDNYWNLGMPGAKDLAVPTFLSADMVKKIAPSMTRGYLQAWDPVKQEVAWRVDHTGPWNGGLLCTDGNLVFQGNGNSEFVAYSADKGKRLWSFNAQNGIIAAPITYEVDGEQYVSVLAGWGGSIGLSFSIIGNANEEQMTREGRLLTFKLGAEGELPPVVHEKRLPEPPELTSEDKKLVTKGNKLYHANCVYCHGPAAISNPRLKDLRYMDAKVHEQFDAIVLGGLFIEQGMPAFSDIMSQEDSKAIHAYLTKLGHKALKLEQQGGLWKSIKNVVFSTISAISSFFIGIVTWLVNAG